MRCPTTNGEDASARSQIANLVENRMRIKAVADERKKQGKYTSPPRPVQQVFEMDS